MIAKYSEDDLILEVEILKDNSDDEWKRFDLKIIKIIQKSKIYKSSGEIGEIFTFEQKKGNYYFPGKSRLEIEQEE